VLIHGQFAPQVGNVCMDQMMVDVTDIPNVQEGDIVTLFGGQAEAMLPVEELAQLTGTINYEVVSVVGRRVPRVYLEEGKEPEVVDYLLGTIL
jgi:alanine racemase